MKVVIDCNVWVSFGLGHGLGHLPGIIRNPRIKIFHSSELLNELKEVLQRPKIKARITRRRYLEIFELIRRFSDQVELKEIRKFSGDPKDSYLLALCKKSSANYFVTNDELLQSLKKVNGTRIISYKHFLEILRFEFPE